jgi:hypothetical protein
VLEPPCRIPATSVSPTLGGAAALNAPPAVLVIALAATPEISIVYAGNSSVMSILSTLSTPQGHRTRRSLTAPKVPVTVSTLTQLTSKELPPAVPRSAMLPMSPSGCSLPVGVQYVTIVYLPAVAPPLLKWAGMTVA